MSDSIIKNQLSKIIFIVGPTASGKSGLAMEIAQRHDGEIICADSQTLRKDLDIGTAKPSAEDRAEIRHHMLDIIGPYDAFSVTEFQKLAAAAIKDIQSRNKLPIVVGGTGLYVDSLFYQYDLNEQKSSADLKKQLQSKSVQELQQIIINNKWQMPENRDNPRHLIGLILRGGQVRHNSKPVKGAMIYGILPDDETLKSRINNRIETMFANGFVHEVEGVLEKHGRPPKTLDAIGYPITIDYLDGHKSLDEIVELFSRGHWQYARRQKSWFKRNEHIIWSSSSDEALQKIEQIL